MSNLNPLLLRRGGDRREPGWSGPLKLVGIPDLPGRSRWSRPPLLKRRGRAVSYCVCPPLDAAPNRFPSTETDAVFTLLLPSLARLPLSETIIPSFMVDTDQPVR